MRAVEKVKDLMSKQDKKDSALRVFVQGGVRRDSATAWPSWTPPTRPTRCLSTSGLKVLV